MSQGIESLKTKAHELDQMVRKGHSSLVRKELIQMKGRRLPRAVVLDFAGLARRIGLFDFALRALHPLVRSEKEIHPPVTTSEIAMYAAVLVKIGAIREAHSLLSMLNSERSPEVLLFQSNAYFGEWKYQQAIPLLRRYTRHPMINDYQKNVGEMNLAAAYIVTGALDSAENLLQNLLDRARTEGLQLLQGNALELLTQVAVLRGDPVKARECIDQSEKLIGTTGDHNSLYMRKWQAVAKALEKTEEGIEELTIVRGQAFQQSNWEIARDCDFQRAIVQNDHGLLSHVIFGTPYASYRKRALSGVQNFVLPESLIWRPGYKLVSYKNPPEQHWDTEHPEGLKHGQTLHRALNILTHDFYAPLPLGKFFAELYPEEVFNPLSSPKRVFRLIQRLRQWFHQQNIPLGIVAKNGEYRLEAVKPFGLRVTLNREIRTPEEYQIERLRRKWPYQCFSSQEAARELGLSSDRFLQLISESEKSGDIIRLGAGRSTQYRFVA